MPKFNVTVTRDTTESTVVDVEADDIEHAKALALAEAHDEPGKFTWVEDDCVAGEPYLADPDNCVEDA